MAVPHPGLVLRRSRGAQALTPTAQRHVIVLGTDPEDGRGGIASALPAFLSALGEAGYPFDRIPTHSASQSGGRWRPFVRSIPTIIKKVREARRAGRKPVAYVHVGGGAVSGARKFVLGVLLRGLRVPVVMQLHGPEVARYLGSSLQLLLLRALLSPASCIAVLTPWWARELKRAGIRGEVFVVPNALDPGLERTATRPRPSRDRREQVQVLTMARMVPEKGFELVLEAIPRVREDVRFVFAGSGPIEGALIDRARQLGIAHRIDFVGWLNAEDKQRALEAADIFCLPSSFDSFGMGYIEAMAHSLPVIALDWGPIPDVLPPDAMLVPTRDAQRLAEAINTLGADRHDRLIRGGRGAEWVLERFSPRAVSHRIMEAVESTC